MNQFIKQLKEKPHRLCKLFGIKIIVVFFLAGALNAFAIPGRSQVASISLHMENTAVKEVLSKIEAKSGYYFTYNLSQLDADRKVSIRVKNKPVPEILDILFKNQKVKYEIKENYIVLYKDGQAQAPAAFSQPERKINGRVTDNNGEPVAGASVILKGKKAQTATDGEGRFEITASPGDVLMISFIGYQTREITVGNQTSIQVTLQEDMKSLSEVVVVGYGTQKKEIVTAAISTIQSKEITTTTSAGLAQSLAGKVPGLQIRQQDGEPGSFQSRINIRGFGEPLYVIDGIVRDNGVEFQQLNPNDIESISILKDASAAVYGLNAANGVIMVTTKKGIIGKPKFSYKAVTGWQTPTDVPEMATAAQYLEMYDNAIFFRDGVHSISKEELAKWQAGSPGYESTDWYNETMKKSAFQHNHDFSVRGGSDQVNYFVSLGYYGEDGLLKSNDMSYNRYNFRSNLSLKLTDDLSTEVMLSGRYNKRAYPGGDGFMWIYKGTIINYPHERPYINDDPNYPANIYNQQNSVIMAQEKYAGYTNNEYKNFQSSAAIIYKAPFLKGLQAKATFAYDSFNNYNKNVWKNYKVYSPDLTSQVLNPPRIANSVDDANRMVFQGQVSYKATFAGSHNVDGTLVSEFKKYDKTYYYLKREYDFFTTDVMDFASGLQTNAGNEVEEAAASYVGRLHYDYKSKYLLGYTFRYDGSYRYTPENRWAFFPAVSAGWRISEENFVKNNFSFINDLKLRGSYGMIGEAVGEPFQYALGFTSSPGRGAEFSNGTHLGGLVAPGVINPDFTWVKSRIGDVGIEGTLFKRLLTFEFDYYQRYKTGMLKRRDGGIPNTFGGDMPIENITSEETRGFDMLIGHQNDRKAFKYGMSFNLNLGRTRWRNTDRPDPRSSHDRWSLRYDDRWNDFVWGYKQTGQFQNYEQIIQAPIYGGDKGNSQLLPGDYTYEDVNGDGIINNEDMLPIYRKGNPKLFYGFTLNANWKNFDMYTVFQGASLYTMRFNEVFSQMFFNNGNIPAYFFDRWHLADPYDPNSEWVPGRWPANRFAGNMQSSYRESSIWRMNASYLRMKSIEVGYTFPSSLSKKLRLDRVRVYANAHNLLTFADSFIKQFDPEKHEGAYEAGYNYPLTKSYNFGVNVSF